MSKEALKDNTDKWNKKSVIESQIVQILRTQKYTLNTVNIYGENLLHISAANGCSNIAKEILKSQESRRIIDRKSKFGWTPLMQAIRNRDIATVKLLLQHNANVNEYTYLGMSVLGLATAINKEMFETVYNACPSALQNAAHDDISPLCVAAMKNDKDLFFTLIEKGLDVSKANEYTLLTMKQSTVPKIANLAKVHLSIEDYWYDTSDNIETEDVFVEEEEEEGKEEATLNVSPTHNQTNDALQCKDLIADINDNRSCNTNSKISKLIGDEAQPNRNLSLKELKRKELQCLRTDILPLPDDQQQQSLISPILTYVQESDFSVASNVCYIRDSRDAAKEVAEGTHKEHETDNKAEELESSLFQMNLQSSSPLALKRLQSVRPADLNISQLRSDHDTSLGFTPEFTPSPSPYGLEDVNEESAYGEDTPTPPRYRTPPRGMILNSQQSKMVFLLKEFGLDRQVPMFLEQEIDIDVFVTLTDDDLVEIGVLFESDRKAILKAVNTYKNMEM